MRLIIIKLRRVYSSKLHLPWNRDEMTKLLNQRRKFFDDFIYLPWQLWTFGEKEIVFALHARYVAE